MTPIFSRIWLVKMQQVRAFEIREVSLRSAALIKRACAPTVVARISPSSSAVVTETHDGAITVILGDLLNGEVEIFVAGGGHFVFAGLLSGFSGHNSTVN